MVVTDKIHATVLFTSVTTEKWNKDLLF